MSPIYLLVAVFGLLVSGVLTVVFLELRKQSVWIDAHRQLLERGAPATAMVRTVGPSPRGRLVFTLSLDVQPTGEPAFAAETEVLVPMHAAGAVAPGKPVAVRYDAVSRAVTLDLAAMGYAI